MIQIPSKYRYYKSRFFLHQIIIRKDLHLVTEGAFTFCDYSYCSATTEKISSKNKNKIPSKIKIVPEKYMVDSNIRKLSISIYNFKCHGSYK